MSAGKFTKARYETDSGLVAVCRVQPETLLLTVGTGSVLKTNISSPKALTVPWTLPLSRGRRIKPISARYVLIEFTGTLPDRYSGKSLLKVPCLTKEFFDATLGESEGTYLGQPIKVAGRGIEIAK